jgi:hypothetical protein
MNLWSRFAMLLAALFVVSACAQEAEDDGMVDVMDDTFESDDGLPK